MLTARYPGRANALMKNFRRSLKYLWPYRARLGASMACVVAIAVLWGGGLAALLPGMKILISEEGLHGWAWNSLAQDMLEVRLVQQAVPPRPQIGSLAKVLNVVRAPPSGRAAKAGMRDADWIVGLEDGDPEHRFIRGDFLAEALAGSSPGQRIVLRVYDPAAKTTRVVTLTAAKPGLPARLLGRLARALPQPRTLAGRFPLLLYVLGFALAVSLLRGVLRFTQEYLVGSAVFRGIMDLRCDNYHVVLRLPTTFFSRQGVSDSMSRFIADSAELAHGQRTLFGKTLVEPAKALVVLALAMYWSWQLTLLAMVAGPPALVLIRKLGKRMRRASRRALESQASMLAVLSETLLGIRVVKAYTMEAAERGRFFRVNRTLLAQRKKMLGIDSATGPAVEALGMTAAMGAVALAGYWVFNRPEIMDRERFLAVMGCLAALYDPVRKLAKVFTRFQRSEAAAARVFELQDQTTEKRVPGAPMLPRHAQSIEFRNVSFRYPGAAEDALKDVSLLMPAGETLAIVGPNGSGKTTLASMLPRLLEPRAGSVLIDGRDIHDHSVRSVRRQIAVVTQEAVLFHATIADNIAYGKRRPKAEEVVAAAQRAFVDEFVAQMPDGYETMVGERGATLSGGQRQRITIARAILRDPAILIFDEAMSQVDPESERKIHLALEEFMAGRTTILIAHRFATIRQAGRIAVMEAGRIIDVGTHSELLSRCPLYEQLCRTQFVALDLD